MRSPPRAPFHLEKMTEFAAAVVALVPRHPSGYHAAIDVALRTRVTPVAVVVVLEGEASAGFAARCMAERATLLSARLQAVRVLIWDESEEDGAPA